MKHSFLEENPIYDPRHSKYSDSGGVSITPFSMHTVYMDFNVIYHYNNSPKITNDFLKHQQDTQEQEEIYSWIINVRNRTPYLIHYSGPEIFPYLFIPAKLNKQ